MQTIEDYFTKITCYKKNTKYKNVRGREDDLSQVMMFLIERFIATYYCTLFSVLQNLTIHFYLIESQNIDCPQTNFECLFIIFMEKLPPANYYIMETKNCITPWKLCNVCKFLTVYVKFWKFLKVCVCVVDSSINPQPLPSGDSIGDRIRTA